MTAVGTALPPWANATSDLDPAHLRVSLQHGLPGYQDGGLLIDGLRVLKMRRSNSQRNPRPIKVYMELDVRDARSGRSGTQLLYGEAFRDGASAAAFASVDQTALVQPAFGSAVARLPGADMLVWAWPNDPCLTQLPQLLDLAALQNSLHGMPSLKGFQAKLTEVLRYEPARRAIFRVGLEGSDGSPTLATVYGKTFGDDQAQALHQRFEFFWRLSEVDVDAPCVAQPLGFDAATRTLWQAPAPGRPLMDVARSLDASDAFARLGRALACLHAAKLPVTNRRSTQHWIAEVPNRLRKISGAAPGLAARAGALAETIVRAAEQLPEARETLIHGDFHPDQAWLSGSRVVLFDFDEFALGNPMEDVAEFTVKLEQAGLPPQQCERYIEALIDGYRGKEPAYFDAQWLKWHRTLQTLLQTSRALSFQPPGWRKLVVERFAACEVLAASLLSKATV